MNFHTARGAIVVEEEKQIDAVAKWAPPIFVVGAPRSGTTLTAGMLGNHRDIFTCGETHFIEDIYNAHRELGDPVDPIARQRIIDKLRTLYGRYNESPDQERVERMFDDGDLPRMLDGCRTYPELFDTFMRCQAEAAGKCRWGHHVPRDVFEVKTLLRFFPDARVIGCVRDPRDFQLSYRDKWRRGEGWEADRLKKLYHPILTAMLWRGSMNALDRRVRQFGERIFVNQYEAMVSDPEAQARKICAFVGEPYDPAMLDVSSENSSSENAQQEKRIFTSSIARWRGRLSHEEIILCQLMCGRLMSKFGYRLEPQPVNALAVAHYVLTLPGSTIRALTANRTKRGPLLPYLVKRIKSLIPW